MILINSNLSGFNIFSPNKVSFSGNDKKAEKKPTAIICDTFKTKSIDMDIDDHPDISHGFLVHKAFEDRNPNVKIEDVAAEDFFDSKKDKSVREADGMAGAMEKIAKRVKNEQNVDLVNLSYGIDVDIPKLAKEMDIPVTRNNIDQYRKLLHDEILNEADKSKLDKTNSPLIRANPKFTKEKINILASMIKSVEKITKSGVNVFIAAGNYGPECVNLLTLAKGAISVGAVDSQGKMLDISANNSLIKELDFGKMNVKPVIRNNKVAGYSVTGKDKVDLPLEETSCGKLYEQPLDKVLGTKEDYQILKTYIEGFGKGTSPEYLGLTTEEIEKARAKVYPIKQLAKMYDVEPSKINRLSKYGDYTDTKFLFAMKADKDNKLQITWSDLTGGFQGTSFASPRAGAKSVDNPRNAKNIKPEP